MGASVAGSSVGGGADSSSVVVRFDGQQDGDAKSSAGVVGMTAELAMKTMERWGFPVLVAAAFGWVLRNDLIVPLIEEHRAFVKTMAETQREISSAMNEQAKILHVLEERMKIE